MNSEKDQVLELRQLGQNTLQYVDENGNVRNGDFKTRLKKSVILNNGDTIRLNQVFLQTTELDEDVINIEESLRLRIDYIRYLRDVDNISFIDSTNRLTTREDIAPEITPKGNTGFGIMPPQYTPTFFVNQNTLNNYCGASNLAGDKHQLRQRKGEIMLEARNLRPTDIIALQTPQQICRIFKTLTFIKVSKSKVSPRFNCILEFKDLRENFVNIVLTIPAMKLGTNKTTLDVNVFALGDTTQYPVTGYYKIINLKQLLDANIEVEDNPDFDLSTPITNSLPVSCPIYESKIINISAGKYQAGELAKIITDKFTDSQLSSSTVVDTPESLIQQPSLIGSAEQDVKLATGASNLPLNNSFNTTKDLKYFVSSDGQRFNLYGTIGPNLSTLAGSNIPQPFFINDPPMYCGSDSFAFEYDQDIKKFKLTKIHTSIRDDSGNIAIQLLENPLKNVVSPRIVFPPPYFPGQNPSDYTNTPLHSYLASSYGGIIMTSMSAFIQHTNEFFDFWEGIAKMDIGLNTTRPTQNGLVTFKKTPNTFTPVTPGHNPPDPATRAFTTVAEDVVSFTLTTQTTDNITDDTSTIDGLHELDFFQGTSTQRGHKYYNFINTKTDELASQARIPIFIDTSTTSEIFAVDVLELDNIDFAYYLIDISAKIENEYITDKDVKRNIFSAINRYYISGGYLSGTNSGIQYSHVGESIIISDFDVRILKPDGTVADNLNADNTVFLEIVRAEAE